MIRGRLHPVSGSATIVAETSATMNSNGGSRMRPGLATVLSCVVTLMAAAAGAAAEPTRADLTGRWVTPDGGVYYVRQVGTDVWWSGKRLEPRGKDKVYTNVFHGTIRGNVITGSWV